MNRYVKVEGHEGFVRDIETGAIINTVPQKRKSFSNEFKNVVDDLNTLKEEISEIKTLLKKLLQ